MGSPRYFTFSEVIILELVLWVTDPPCHQVSCWEWPMLWFTPLLTGWVRPSSKVLTPVEVKHVGLKKLDKRWNVFMKLNDAQLPLTKAREPFAAFISQPALWSAFSHQKPFTVLLFQMHFWQLCLYICICTQLQFSCFFWLHIKILRTLTQRRNMCQREQFFFPVQ